MWDFLHWLLKPQHPTFWVFLALSWTFIALAGQPPVLTILSMGLANVLVDHCLYGPGDWS